MHIVRTGEIAHLFLSQANADFQAKRDAEEAAKLKPYAFISDAKVKMPHAAIELESHLVQVTYVGHRSMGRKIVVSTRFVYPAH